MMKFYLNLSKLSLTFIVLPILITPQIFAAEIASADPQKKDAQTQPVVTQPTEAQAGTAEKTSENKTEDKKISGQKESKKVSAGFYFYPSAGSNVARDSGFSDSGSGSPSYDVGVPSDSGSEPPDGGTAYSTAGPTEPTAPQDSSSLSVPPGMTKGTAGSSNLDDWMAKHPDVKERIQKQQQMINSQIQENQAKLEGQFKGSEPARGIAYTRRPGEGQDGGGYPPTDLNPNTKQRGY